MKDRISALIPIHEEKIINKLITLHKTGIERRYGKENRKYTSIQVEKSLENYCHVLQMQ